MGENDVGPLLEVLAAESARRRSQIRGLISLWLGAAAGFAFLFALQWASKGPPDAATLLIVLCSFASVPTLLTMTSRHQQAAREAAELDDPRLVPHLLDVLDSDSGPIRRLARQALARNLVRVDSAMAGDFDRRHLHLLSGLVSAREEGLSEAAVAALGRVGDIASVAELEAFLKRPRTPRAETVAHGALGELRMRLASAEIRSSGASGPTDSKRSR